MSEDNEKLNVHRGQLQIHAANVTSVAPQWWAVVRGIEGASIEASAFSNMGRRFATAYSDIVARYPGYAWHIGNALNEVGKRLNKTAKNYGDREAIIKDQINSIEKF